MLLGNSIETIVQSGVVINVFNVPETSNCILRRTPAGMGNFNFQWIKTLNQNNVNNIAFIIFTAFKDYRCY